MSHRTSRRFWAPALALAALPLLSMAGSALAATPIYVRTDGSDTLCNGEHDAGVGSAPNCAVATIAEGVDLVDAGGTVHVGAGTFVVGAQITLNKALTLDGSGAGSTIVQVSGTGERFLITASGVTIQELEIEKTDKTGVQNIIGIQASNATIQDTLIHGQYAFGDPDVSRAIVISAGLSGLLIDDNTIHSLRQPAYVSGPTTGTVSDNVVYGTRGFVLENGDLTFTGNSWGSGNTFDIVVLDVAGGTYYTDIVALSDANDDAVVEDQRPAQDVLSIVSVDDSAAGGGNGGRVQPYQTIGAAIPRVVSGGRVEVAAGTYVEDVDVTKSATIQGAGAGSTTVSGPSGGPGATFTVNALDVVIEGFTITREGNTVATWNDAGLNFAGIAIQGLSGKSMEVRHNVITGNRTGIDINNNGGAHVHNNAIDFNHTGMILRNTTDDVVLEENEITNNRTVGVLFLDASSGSNVPVQSALDGSFSGNDISGNWYGGIVDRQSGGSLPTPGTTNLKNFSGNWYGTASPVVSTANSMEPGYASHIPVAYGGLATNPGGAPDILGPASANFDYTPWLAVGTDTDGGAVGFEGDFTEVWVDDAGAQTGGEGRVQEGVDSVTGSTVNVAAGTYEEQVEIDATLTLQGVGPASVIKSPTTLTKSFTTPGPNANKPVIYVHGADDVVIKNLTVDGAGRGNSNYRFVGIGFNNAGGTVQNTTITDVRDTPFSGTQHGNGIYAYNDDATSREFDILNNTITGFQKTGIVLNAASNTPIVVDVDGNTVVGHGNTTITAQNGIQVFAELATGTIDGNTVSGIAYDGASWVATTILNYYGDLDITDNVISGAQVGIYNIDGAGSLTGNSIGVAEAGDYSWGIIATDPPLAVPQPFDGTALLDGGGPDGVPGNPDTGRSAFSPDVVLDVDVSNNVVVYTGDDNATTFGIETDAGYGPDDLDVTVDDNFVSGFEYGIVWYHCTSGCLAGVYVGMSATGNCLAGNDVGMESNVTYLDVTAEGNWWGDASGPYHATANPTGTGVPVSDEIDFTPWDTVGCSVGDAWLNTRTGVPDGLQASLNAAEYGDTLLAVGVDSPLTGGATANQPGVTLDLDGKTAGPGSPFLTVAAADVVVTNGVLDGGGSPDPAILVTTGGDNFTLTDTEVKGWADGVRVGASVTSFKMAGNWVHSNADAGLQIEPGVGLSGIVTIEGNLFKVNGGSGIDNDGVAVPPLPAEYNSWGHVGGPASGDGVSAGVDATPWTFAEPYVDMVPDTDATEVTVSEGSAFSVKLKAVAENLNAIEFALAYDPTYLTLGSTTFAAPWAGTCVDLGSGPGLLTYRCSLLIAEWDGGDVATLGFTAANPLPPTATGPWVTLLDLGHDEDDTSAAAIGGVKVFVDNAGYNAPSTLARDITDGDDGEVNIIGKANYSGFVDLQGRTNDSGAVVSVYNQATKLGAIELADGTSGVSGSYATAHNPPYELLVGTTYHLYADRNLFVATTATLPPAYAHSKLLSMRPLTALATVVLRGGDAYNDNLINISDASCIGTFYGTMTAACGGGSPAGSSPDVNEDGIVNILDLSLMGGNYGITSSTWAP